MQEEFGRKIDELIGVLKSQLNMQRMILWSRSVDQVNDMVKSERGSDPRRLLKFGFKVFSQNDEDGIIREIFRRIGTRSRRFLEFGVERGLECNSFFLVQQGWTGAWIEGNKDYVASIERTHSHLTNSN